MIKNELSPEILSHRIRVNALNMTSSGKSSHIGSVLSMADIVGTLYARILNVDPTRPEMDDRDRFILSKGHAGAGIYAALAERGFFNKELLKQHYQNGSIMSGHVSHKSIPGVEFSTGSLGHGLGIGAGMALAAKHAGDKWRTCVLMSDGECDEGSIWEAAMFSSHHELTNLMVVVDYNKIQSLARVSQTLALEPFSEKWGAFGWEVAEVDGHNHDELMRTFQTKFGKMSKPLVVIAHTTKGKGVSFMEDSVLWHYRSAQGQEFEDAMNELIIKSPE